MSSDEKKKSLHTQFPAEATKSSTGVKFATTRYQIMLADTAMASSKKETTNEKEEKEKISTDQLLSLPKKKNTICAIPSIIFSPLIPFPSLAPRQYSYKPQKTTHPTPTNKLPK